MVKLVHVTDTNLAYLVLGTFAVVFAAFSLLVREKLYLGEVVLGTAFGVILGPYAANVFDPRSWATNNNAITLEVTRVVLAAGVFAIGVELPKSYLWRKRRSLLITVIPTMAAGWVISAAFMKLLFPRLNYISCLLICSTLTPTDPILANAIINGKFATKHVPKHLRLLLAAESAANDGLAYPFLSISMYLTLEARKGIAVEKWFLVGWLYEVLFGVVLGALIGRLFSFVMRYSRSRGFIDRESYVAQYIALAISTVGIANLLGSDDLLAAFAAGSAISWDGDFNDQTEDTIFSSVIDLLLNCACFIYIGAWLPFSSFNLPDLGIVPWRLIVLFLTLLAVRRLPVMLLIYHWVPDIHNWREALFCGHFGPMGVGAVFISTLALSELPAADNPPQDQVDILALSIQPIVAFMVLGSIMIHGLSIPFFSLSRRVHTYSYTLSRTVTVRSAAPDWLSLTRRAPGPEPFKEAPQVELGNASQQLAPPHEKHADGTSHERDIHIHQSDSRVDVRVESRDGSVQSVDTPAGRSNSSLDITIDHKGVEVRSHRSQSGDVRAPPSSAQVQGGNDIKASAVSAEQNAS